MESVDGAEKEKTASITYEISVMYRYFRRKLSGYLRKRLKTQFKKVLYVTMDVPPRGYVLAFQKQYPDKEICVLTQLLKPDGCDKFHAPVEFYYRNKTETAQLYKLPPNNDNIQIYGVYSEIFSEMNYPDERYNVKYMGAFACCARIFAEKLGVEVVHADRVPFFLGSEFGETKTNRAKIGRRFGFGKRIKIFQVVDDIAEYNMEPFWSFLNIAGKAGMKRLSRDKYVKKYISQLFDIPPRNLSKKMGECLETIYNNYVKFRSSIKQDDAVSENNVFKRLDSRVLKLFPVMNTGNALYYNPMIYSMKHADRWAVLSKSYYEYLYESPEVPDYVKKLLTANGSAGLYTETGDNETEQPKLMYKYDISDFRDGKPKNKKYLIKEFSEKRIDTGFVDRSFFKEKEPIIEGYLDPFYDTPLLLYTSDRADDENVVCVINAILKMFEMNKIFQVIINIPMGLRNGYIKSFVEFCKEHSGINGRWLFINSELNLSPFYAAADILMCPERANRDYDKMLTGLKYGCIPVVSRSGINNDIIIDIYDDLNFGCGLKADKYGDFNENYLNTVMKALAFYNESGWNALVRNAMRCDTGWDFEKIEKYNSVYDELIKSVR